jgi:hypothetical protein
MSPQRFFSSLCPALAGACLLSTGSVVLAEPLLVYTLAENSAGQLYFHNPAKPMILRQAKVVATTFVIRDIDPEIREEFSIQTAVVGASKFYLLPLATAGDFTTVVSNYYQEESRFLSFANNLPSVGVEMRNHHENGDGRALTSSLLGRDTIFTLAKPTTVNPKNLITVTAPKTFSLSGRMIYERNVTATSPERISFPNDGEAITNLKIGGTMTLSTTYSTAVNNPDAKDTATPASLTPGTLPYAAYRMKKLLEAAKYFPKP